MGEDILPVLVSFIEEQRVRLAIGATWVNLGFVYDVPAWDQEHTPDFSELWVDPTNQSSICFFSKTVPVLDACSYDAPAGDEGRMPDFSKALGHLTFASPSPGSPGMYDGQRLQLSPYEAQVKRDGGEGGGERNRDERCGGEESFLNCYTAHAIALSEGGE